MTQIYDRDDEHLKLLGIFHYVMAALNLMGCAVGAMYAGMAVFVPVAMSNAPAGDVPDGLPAMIGGVFGVLGVGLMLLSITAAALTAYAGWSLHRRRNRILILVIAALHLLNVPFGTLLGVLTIIVMSRPEVTAEFEAGRPGGARREDRSPRGLNG